MSLTVPLSRVKERCGLSTTDFDTLISNLTYDTLAALAFAIQDAVIADTGNSGLQATLNLAALEIVSGEFLVIHRQWPGFAESLQIGELKVTPGSILSADDPSGWKAQGWRRLAPYLKVPQASLVPAAVSAVAGKREREEGADE